MSTPNLYDSLRHLKRTHEECWEFANPVVAADAVPMQRSYRLGDLRRCQHKKVQVVAHPETSGPLRAEDDGPDSWRWMDIDPVTQRTEYRVALKLLRGRS